MTIREVTTLVKFVKADILDEFRAFEGDEQPGILLTIASTNGKEWGFQTGDNSYMGACYHYNYWGVAGVYRDSNCREVAKDLVNQVKEQIGGKEQ